MLSSSEDEARRVWFFVDEFASWGRIEGIEPLLTKARIKGGVGVLGLQSISQVREAYGQQTSQTILSNLGTWLTLRCGDGETAEFMSRNIGEQEIIRFTTNDSDQGGKSHSEQHSKQRAIMPAELQSLSDLIGVLNVVGNLPAAWVQVPISGLQKVAEAFMLPDYSAQPQKTHQPTPQAEHETDHFN